jgi:GH24 family phage-related lysozyme (muramidase)
MNDSLKISKRGLDLIKEFEGYHTRLDNGDCKAYLDKLPNPDVWTIGYGCTDGVYEGLIWTKEQAERELRKEVEANANIVKRVIKVTLNQHQFDALNSFSYNMRGGLSPKRHRSLVNAVNREDWKAAADCFLMYNRSGGVPVRGLTRRREAERKLFMTLPPKEVVSNSTKLTVMSRVRTFLVTLVPTGGLVEFFGYMGQVKEFASDNWLALLLLSGGSVWLLLKYIEWKSVADHNDGNYMPSGAVETREETHADEKQGSNQIPDEEDEEGGK